LLAAAGATRFLSYFKRLASPNSSHFRTTLSAAAASFGMPPLLVDGPFITGAEIISIPARRCNNSHRWMMLALIEFSRRTFVPNLPRAYFDAD